MKSPASNYTRNDYEHERYYWLHAIRQHRARFRVHRMNVRSDIKADQHHLCSIRKLYYKAS